ncbi:hypothetical protein [Streptomyces sp. SID3343]|uniref:hypothetical protein n=1 Tax=Streptomyces sp. SID3343 TaxID=2690260 RepID=UPI001370A389|nr:hypothetical protein [Streptomyces sp. SID3343]MYW01271.1 hypothetical protein [Streptomyces sp. SID3343]
MGLLRGKENYVFGEPRVLAAEPTLYVWRSALTRAQTGGLLEVRVTVIGPQWHGDLTFLALESVRGEWSRLATGPGGGQGGFGPGEALDGGIDLAHGRTDVVHRQYFADPQRHAGELRLLTTVGEVEFDEVLRRTR